MNKKEQQRENTRINLLQIAHKEFSEKGFAKTALEDIVKKAGLTRGALYHQFAGKKQLFAAVFEKVQIDLVNHIRQVGQGQKHLFNEFKMGTFAFIEIISQNEFRQIILIDGPAVLGWAKWREIDASYSFRELQEGVKALIAEKIINGFTVDALSTLLSGSLNEAAMTLAHAPDRKKMLVQIRKNWFSLLEKLTA